MIMVERVLVAAATEPTGDTEGDQMSMQGVIKHLATTAIESQKERMAQAAVELAEAQMAGDKSAVAVYANTFTAAEMLIRDTSFLVD